MKNKENLANCVDWIFQNVLGMQSPAETMLFLPDIADKHRYILAIQENLQDDIRMIEEQARADIALIELGLRMLDLAKEAFPAEQPVP